MLFNDVFTVTVRREEISSVLDDFIALVLTKAIVSESEPES